IVILSTPEPVEMSPGVWLLPAPLEHRHTLEDPTARFDSMETPGATLRIGLAHGSIRDFGSPGETKNQIARSEERRVGKEGASTFRTQGSPCHKKNKKQR